MEYVTEQLIEQLNEELNTEKIYLLNRYALLKATAKDYIRDSQIRIILKPLLEKLSLSCGSPQVLKQKLQHLLLKLQEEFARLPGYGGGNILNLFRQLEINLAGYDFSNLRICQAYLQDVNLHQVNFAHAELTNCVFAQTFGGITSIAFSSDGQLQATSDTNGKIQIWTTDGKLLFVCKGHNSWVWFVAFSPNNQVLASCSQDHTIKLWDMKTGQCLRTLPGHTSIVTSFAFHPHDQVLASSSEDRTIKLWDINTGKCLSTLQEHQGCVWTVTFSPDGQTLVSGGEDDTIKIWDAATGQCLKTL